MSLSKKSKGGNDSGGSGVRCTGCKGTGWVEFTVTKEVPVRSKDGKSIQGYETKTGVTNTKCGNCDGTGWK